MRVSHFIVPPAAYPRYLYTREHVTPLLKRFKDLSEKCHITDPFTIPLYADVHIYVISEDDSEILSIADIATRCSADISRNDISCTDVVDFRSQCPDILATVHVASYKQAQKRDKILEYCGQYNVLIVDEGEQIEAVSPECKGLDDKIMCVKKRNDFAKEMGMLLERIVFNNLLKRVQILQAFLAVEHPTEVFAAVDLETQSILKNKFDTTRSSSVERDAIHLHDEWCNARLLAIKRKISSGYGKRCKEVRKQLLDESSYQDDQRNGRNITALKICEDIIPHFNEGSITSGSKKIPESLLAQVKVMQRSQETTQKAVLLETRFKIHLVRVVEHRSEIEQLVGVCMGMYHRSKVPMYERPGYVRAESPTLSEQVARDILRVKGVTGCGFRFNSLDIYVKDTLTDDENTFVLTALKGIAEENRISEYQVRTEQDKLTQFADYGVGSKLTSRLERSASLGGFVLKGENQDLCMVLARHLADDGKPLFVKDPSGNKSVIAHVLEPEHIYERCASLDIAVANVLKKVRPHCMTKFKHSSGSPLDSTLIEFGENEIEWLKGLPVHIWGAASSPGLGTVIIPDFYVEGMKRLVKIEDRHPVDSENIESFCKSGDSGAVICADDPDGEVVHVISMVMGSSNYDAKEKDPKIKGEYLSVRLKDGLNQMKQEHKDTFRLC